MSDIDRAVRAAKRFEALLEQRFGARGRGLHEKLTSVERDLPPPLVRRIRFIATVRNKLVHEDGFDRIDDRRGFRSACRQARRQLKQLARQRAPLRTLLWRAVWFAIVPGILVAAAWFAWTMGWFGN